MNLVRVMQLVSIASMVAMVMLLLTKNWAQNQENLQLAEEVE